MTAHSSRVCFSIDLSVLRFTLTEVRYTPATKEVFIHFSFHHSFGISWFVYQLNTAFVISHLPLFLTLSFVMPSPPPHLVFLKAFTQQYFSALLPSSPASLPPTAGGRFRGPGGDNLTVDGAQQQHEQDGFKHLGGRYPMRLRDGHIQECCSDCEKYEQTGFIRAETDIKLK